MSIDYPYYRIIRPCAFAPDYVIDRRYASDRINLRRSYKLLERELEKIFSYIEPAENNKNVFSHEIYALFIRACTEVEQNCKLIMEANNYNHSGNYTMNDYVKLEKSSKLSLYKISYSNWKNYVINTDGDTENTYQDKIIQPFASFSSNNGNNPHSPQWYVAYNHVKHNREKCFNEATLDNCIHAIAGVFVLLYSQFGFKGILYDSCMSIVDNDDYDEIPTTNNSIFNMEVKPEATDWLDDELYKFDWKKIKSENSPIQQFSF